METLMSIALRLTAMLAHDTMAPVIEKSLPGQ